jgi:hypothetical protein
MAGVARRHSNLPDWTPASAGEATGLNGLAVMPRDTATDDLRAGLC